MATVAERPRARKDRAPRPAVPSPSRPVERHGQCSLWLSIGGVRYKLRPFPPAEASGIVAIWSLTKIDTDRADGPRAYAVASDGQENKCTCPDFSVNGARCKHIGALVALRLLPAREGGAR